MATYYFSQGAMDDDWANSNNWYFDSNGTIPANSVPSSTDDAIILGFLNSDSSSSATINNLFISGGNTGGLSITVLGLCTIDGGYFGDGATITGDVLVTTNGYLLGAGTGTIIGDLTFANNGQGEGGANNTDVYGNVYFLGNWTGPYAGSINIYNNYNAIFYYGYTGSGSYTFYGTGISYYANYPTLYFNGAVDDDWSNIGNWWVDNGFSNPSYNIPNATDDVIASVNIGSNSGSEPTVVNFTTNGGIFEINITVTGTATIANNNSYNYTITGNAIFSDGGYLDGGIINGNATFNGYLYQSGTVNGDATFNGDTKWSSGTISGHATFNDNSYNRATLNNATFNDGSHNGASGEGAGTVNGDCTFNDNSYNFGDYTFMSYVYGNCTFNDYAYNDGSVGSISTTTTFNDNSHNDTIYGVIEVATFNNFSRNYGVINGCSFYNNSANYTYASVLGVASFYDNSENYIDASAYESQYYDYSVCNNADATNPHYFHDNSTAINLTTNGSNGSIDGFPFKIVSGSLDPLTFIRAGYGINNSNILGLV